MLEVDLTKRRISLGLKQATDNPWEEFDTNNNIGDVIKGEINNITEFGLFVGLTDDIDGLVHLSDISWSSSSEEVLEKFKKGDNIEAKILDIDLEKERISLGIKQLTSNPAADAAEKVKKGDAVTCVITAVTEQGLEVRVGDSLSGFIKRTDLARDRSEQRVERFAVDEKVDAIISQIDSKNNKLTLSIKSREMAEEKQAMAEFGSSDSGASLGDILGAALAKKEDTSSE